MNKDNQLENSSSWIPRNLNKDDVIKMGMGIEFKIADLPFLSAGGAYSYFLVGTTAAALPIKIVTVTAIMGISYFISKMTIEDKPISEACIDGIVYTSHQIKYKRKRR